MLTTSLLELAALCDAVLAGTHELTPEGLAYMRDRLDAAAALATTMERKLYRPRGTADGNVIPFPTPGQAFHGFG